MSKIKGNGCWLSLNTSVICCKTYSITFFYIIFSKILTKKKTEVEGVSDHSLLYSISLELFLMHASFFHLTFHSPGPGGTAAAKREKREWVLPCLIWAECSLLSNQQVWTGDMCPKQSVVQINQIILIFVYSSNQKKRKRKKKTSHILISLWFTKQDVYVGMCWCLTFNRCMWIYLNSSYNLSVCAMVYYIQSLFPISYFKKKKNIYHVSTGWRKHNWKRRSLNGRPGISKIPYTPWRNKFLRLIWTV